MFLLSIYTQGSKINLGKGEGVRSNIMELGQGVRYGVSFAGAT